MLPSFFVIGAAKAGTSSLHEYLDLHPEIAMTQPKEPHVLAGPGWRDRLEAYAQLFRVDAPLRGECSTGYSVYPTNPEVAGRIAHIVPQAPLVYLVRDPVERAIAQYAQAVTVGRERRPIREALRPEDPGNYYVAASRYATQVEVYLRHFAAPRLLVVDQSELRERRQETLSAIFAHVGADPGFWTPAFAAEHNVRGVDNVRLPEPLDRLRRGRLNEASRRLLPPRLRRRAVAAARRRTGTEIRPEPDLELEERLAKALAPEAQRLRRLTGQEFPSWRL